jgi:hypothetical protein
LFLHFFEQNLCLVDFESNSFSQYAHFIKQIYAIDVSHLLRIKD